MIDSKRLLLGASAAVLGPMLGLALTPVQAQSPASAPAPGPEQARADMEQRMEAAMAERNERYQDLRKRAAEVGLELPETPPWADGGLPQPPADMEPPPMPQGMPQPAAGMATERPPMTREAFEAVRQKRWEAMRERAKAMGRELPETPPWEAAEQRRKEMLEKYEAYRATIEAMTDEQKEAIAALFGGRAAEPHIMPQGPMGRPMGGPCASASRGQPCGRGMMPGYGPGPRMGPMMPAMPMMPAGGDEGTAAPAQPPEPAG